MAITIKKGATESMQLPIIPLIDTILNLLIFFLVTAQYAEAERELTMTLPEASEAQPISSRPREMFINIDAQGRYYVTGKFITLKELDQILRATWVNNPGRASVVIRADKRCQWEAVVKAMNACTKAKIRDYRVTTRDPHEGGG